MENTDNQSFRSLNGFTQAVHSSPRTSRAAGAQSSSRPHRKYRTYATRGTGRRTAVKTKYNFKEKILMQCIVCGVLLAVLMFINIINTGFSKDITGWVDARISENIDYSGVSSAGGSISGFFSAVKTAFGYENPAAADDGAQGNVTDDDLGGLEPEIPDNAEGTERGSEIETEGGMSSDNKTDAINVIRVDEDILNEINNAEDIYNVTAD